ncbi:glycosyltransferase family 2 protein [Lentisphaerota bacterium ZTH]|nr:glycosyltransferase [Lentisphaerota bacterium]WET06402.1 glycosyltransferase family 2 protein [Lentisphaerota bacterium ZTH]
MKKFKISIVTVCYNSAEHLEQAMLSVLEQDYDNFEYIVIDGGSTDGSVEIIRKYQDRLTYWISEPDGGIYDAMNKGIVKATGDIVGMINSDDFYLPGAFQKAADAFQKKDLNNHILWGDVQYEIQGLVKGFRPENITMGAFAPHPSMFCPKRIYEKAGLYDTSFRFLGDYDFMYRAINKFKISPIYIPETIAFFREGGLADSNISQCLHDELKVKLKYGQSRRKVYLIFLLKLLKNSLRILKSCLTR